MTYLFLSLLFSISPELYLHHDGCVRIHPGQALTNSRFQAVMQVGQHLQIPAIVCLSDYTSDAPPSNALMGAFANRKAYLRTVSLESDKHTGVVYLIDTSGKQTTLGMVLAWGDALRVLRP